MNLKVHFDQIRMDVHTGHPDMGPTLDPLGPDFQYDFHISFSNSCSNNSTLNEYESECQD